jgi:hypothetical protein
LGSLLILEQERRWLVHRLTRGSHGEGRLRRKGERTSTPGGVRFLKGLEEKGQRCVESGEALVPWDQRVTGKHPARTAAPSSAPVCKSSSSLTYSWARRNRKPEDLESTGKKDTEPQIRAGRRGWRLLLPNLPVYIYVGKTPTPHQLPNAHLPYGSGSTWTSVGLSRGSSSLSPVLV